MSCSSNGMNGMFANVLVYKNMYTLSLLVDSNICCTKFRTLTLTFT